MAAGLGVDVEPLDLPRDLFENEEVELTSDAELRRRGGPMVTRSGKPVTSVPTPGDSDGQ